MDNSYGMDEFKNDLQILDISLNEVQMNRFMEYYRLLTEWNRVMNLTSITDFQEVLKKHFMDSLSLVKVIKPHKERILDLGTGAGFPGIPLKIAFPDTEIVLLDSLNKRINFLNEVIKILGVQKITAVHGRAEDYGRNPDYREGFDLCVSRAVARLQILSEYCLPFVKTGGYFIPYKSGQIDEELEAADKAVHILGARLIKTEEFELPGTDISRSLVLIHKTGSTPKKYPRNAGKPVKEPL